MPYKDKEQQKKAQHLWYERNRNRIYDASRAQRKANRKWLNSLKREPCIDCGLKWPPCVMEFHHRNANEKLGTVADLLINAGRQRIVDEIKKCDLLCSNCHRIRTYPDKVKGK